MSHAVLPEVGDNRDRCCLQALYRNDDGTWDTGAVKHGHVLPNQYEPELSPLYRLASFHGQLPEKEHLLEKASRYINGDEERGAALWNYTYCLCNDRKQQAVTEAQLLFYLDSGNWTGMAAWYWHPAACPA